MIRILLVDDQHLVRSGFRMMLDAEPDVMVVGEASDGAEAVRSVKLDPPDLVLMDVQMPGMDGLEATKEITALDDPPRVLVLTTFERDDYVFTALRNGASGFILKNAPPEQLLEAVRTVAAGEALLAPSVTKRIVEEFARRPAAPAAAAEVDDLTERELDVLRLLARGRTNAEIAEELFVGEATVKTHVSNVLTKLGIRDRVQAVVFAYENGIVAPGEG
ncbi:MAG: response regulator transcription factor [Acidimicrobiia bacterium]|nr:response regulator transcription factor [Acidimicrobiia bacterium]